MNAPAGPFDAAAPTRYRFTGAAVEAMARAGVFHPDARLELIDGELLDMQPEGPKHGDAKVEATNRIVRAAESDVRVAVETPLRLSETDQPVPDIWLYRAPLKASAVRGPDVLLVIELAQSSLAYDVGPKAALYARHGVAEYWVIDVDRARVHVHRTPEGEAWLEVPVIGADEPLSPAALPGLSIRLADFL
jgi:Uma2 family endonuclease